MEEMQRQDSSRSFLARKVWLTYFLLLNFYRIANCQSGECLDVNLRSVACLPGPENIARGRPITINPSRITCGSPPSRYCRPRPRNGCFMCDATNATLNHDPQNMVNRNDPPSSFWDYGFKPTWWQSITWWDASQRGVLIDNTVKVNITFSFNKTYDITGDIKVTFYSAKPKAIIFEKSTDTGLTWTPYAYFADSCATRFSTPIEKKTSAETFINFKAYCEEDTSTIAEQGAQISFNPMTALSRSNFWDKDIQRYLTATDIRIRLEYPWTDGNHNFPQEQFLNQYYYDITNVDINGRCHCNGHGQFCEGDLSKLVCRCLHNTEGIDCERCKPLYNNRTWMAASSSTETNPCQKCQCHDHATSCVFNSTLGYGVCSDCNHNTTGVFCDQCQDKFYRNLSLPINSQQACTPCDCYSFGIANNGSCSQVSTSNVTIGQCDCKSNFKGRKCDICNDGHYGVELPPVGECRACNCSSIGSINSSIVCHQRTGQCSCKQSTDGRTCNACKDGYHSFPNTTDGECQACTCEIGGAFSNVCNKTTGDCFCRRGIMGKFCNTSVDGYFVPSFDFLKSEAETPSDAVSSINGFGRTFTGFGFKKLTELNQIRSFFQPKFTTRYTLVIRYKQEISQSKQLTAIFHYNNNSVSVLLKSFNVTLPSSSTPASVSYRHPEAIELMGNGNYSVTLVFTNSSIANQSLDIDSIALFWDITQSRYYQNANESTRNVTMACWEGRQSIVPNVAESQICKNVAFSINAEIFNGSVACDCNPIGTFNNTYCDKSGGQCRCKPGIGGRTCDQCMPGFFNFSSEGCSACNCTTLGSQNLVCDVVTGQCPCKPGVVNRTCSGCRSSFFGYQTGLGCRNCSCNWDGSAIVFCDENGNCPCKNTTTRIKCDRCKPLHFNFTSNGCMPCNCNPSGSTNLQCDLLFGNCSCKRDSQGAKCDSCKAGYYGLQNANTNGCQSCFCFNKTSQCTTADGFYAYSIQSTFNNQTDGWQLFNSSGLQIIYANTTSGLRFDVSDNFRVTLRAPLKFIGNKLSSYAQTIAVRYTLTPALVNPSVSLTLLIVSEDRNQVSFQLRQNSTLLEQSLVFRLQELYTVEGISANRLQHILASIAAMTIQFNTTGVASITVQRIQMTSASNSIISAESVNFVENCSCPLNFTGNSCENCAPGYTREFPNSGPYTNCKLCNCSSRSTSCNPQTGICNDCRIGTEGDYCERCQFGVLEPNCTRCIPGYYGLNDTSFPGCRPCNCVLLNTVGYNNSVCDEITGQCQCRPHIDGRMCNRCAENAVNTTRDGCQVCSECYRLIQVEVQTLRRDIQNITGSLTSIQGMVRQGSNASFDARLSSLTESISTLTSNARNSSTIESGLAAELSALNFSLDAMQRTLTLNVSQSVNATNDNLRVINGTRTVISGLQTEIYRLLWASNYVLQSDVIGKVNETNDLRSSLDASNNNMSSLWSQYSSQYASIGLSLNQTFSASANTVNATTTVLLRQNQTSAILNSSRIILEQHRNTLITLQTSVLSIQSNLSAILYNVTRLSSDADQALQNASSLNATPDQRFVQLRTRYDSLRTSLSSLNRSMSVLSESHDLMISNLTMLKTRSASLDGELNRTEDELRTLATQARYAEANATNAVNSANGVLTEAQNMLGIVQNFNATARNAENMAEISLRHTDEVNATSLQAMAYTASVRQDLASAVVAATDSLAIAENASYIAGNLSMGLETLLNDSRKLLRDASGSLYTAGFFTNIRGNVTTTATNIVQPRANECRNYTSQAQASKSDAAQSLAAATNLSNEASTRQAALNNVVQSFQRLSTLDSTSLQSLQRTLQQNRERFNASNVKTMLISLQEVYRNQQAVLQGQRATISRLRTEIAETKRAIDDLSTLQGCS